MVGRTPRGVSDERCARCGDDADDAGPAVVAAGWRGVGLRCLVDISRLSCLFSSLS